MLTQAPCSTAVKMTGCCLPRPISAFNQRSLKMYVVGTVIPLSEFKLQFEFFLKNNSAAARLFSLRTKCFCSTISGGHVPLDAIW